MKDTRVDRQRKAFQSRTAEILTSADELDPRDATHPLTFRERLRVAPVIHDVWFALTYWTGIRDRMRCPNCTAVGTFKMHGSLLERWIWKDLALRRWGCKWCGYWISKNGRTTAYPSQSAKSWAFPGTDQKRDPTPAEVVYAEMGRTWPWYG